ncbi:hypothetical protein R1sor_024590 [Riccia sorocarpa]|uniref:Endonuclease/exonuclease/phosphatase domain-containing protein n=1 Tax=Riccia sorocarpa TaxID=122646 RepID=A0ABD3GWZ7_9MARC
MVTRTGNISNRAVWAHIEGEGLNNVGVLAIYAPNQVAERTELWERIRVTVDCTRAWIVLGDFNMITEEKDQKGGTYTGLSTPKREAWEALVRDLRLEDHFEHKEGALWYSWDNLHRGRNQENQPEADDSGSEGSPRSEAPEQAGAGDRILKRLDRIYISEEMTSKITKYEVLDSWAKSDHAPILMSLTDGKDKEKHRARFCMNTSLLRVEEFKYLMKTLEVLNFGKKFQGYIRAILSTASSCILVNGEQSKPVKVTRKGAHNMKKLLDSFAKATGLKIQWEKSAARWIGPNEQQIPAWTEELTRSWKSKGEATRLLGFEFEEGIQHEAMLQWLYTGSRVKSEGMSTVLANILSAWEGLKKFLKPGILYTAADWMKIPIWGTSRGSLDGKIRKLDSRAKQSLWEEGYRSLGDLTSEQRLELATWENRRIKGVDNSKVKKAYSNLTALIEGPENLTWDEAKEVHVWEWSCTAGSKEKEQKPPHKPALLRNFRRRGKTIVHCKYAEVLNQDEDFQPIKITSFKSGQGKIIRALTCSIPSGAEELAELQWANGSGFFLASNGQLRQMLSRDREAVIERVRKWINRAGSE